MYFDPYEKKENKRKRYISNILLIFILVTFVIAILLVVFQKTTIEPITFDQIKFENMSFVTQTDETNEFRLLYSEMKDSNGTAIQKDHNFDEKYPSAAALLAFDNTVYNENIPYTSYEGGYLTIAQSYNSVRTDYRTIDIELIQMSPSKNEYDGKNTNLSFNIYNITRFSINYNTRDGSMSYMAYSETSYRLSLQSITVYLSGGKISNAGYSLNLNGKPDEQTVKKLGLNKSVIDNINLSYHVPSVKIGESRTTISLSQDENDYIGSNEIAYRLLFDVDLLKMFSDMQISATFEGEINESDLLFRFDIN